jgi:RES domain
MTAAELPAIRLRWPKIYRVVPTQFPPINVFERIVDPSQLEAAYYLESLTNDRLREQAGEISLVAPEDRVAGPGSTVVMAAFTHIGWPSRFSDGTWGVYYAARTLETAVRETAYHRGRFLAATAEPPDEVDMRAYIGTPLKPFIDLRSPQYDALHDPDDYSASQQFAKPLQRGGAWGVVYRSVRHEGGECIAAFRPPAVSIPTQGPALAYVWDGQRITHVYEKSEVLFTLSS